LRWRGVSIDLAVKRQEGRRLVVFVRHWFADASGLQAAPFYGKGESGKPSFPTFLYPGS